MAIPCSNNLHCLSALVAASDPISAHSLPATLRIDLIGHWLLLLGNISQIPIRSGLVEWVGSGSGRSSRICPLRVRTRTHYSSDGEYESIHWSHLVSIDSHWWLVHPQKWTRWILIESVASLESAIWHSMHQYPPNRLPLSSTRV